MDAKSLLTLTLGGERVFNGRLHPEADPEHGDEQDPADEAPGENVIKHFFSSSMTIRQNKLDRLSLERLSSLI